ncbi:MAG: hypothetical protein IJ861_00540 [Clostridia bacterium]|nr:hypothetical protein [Clostridia bacterium]
MNRPCISSSAWLLKVALKTSPPSRIHPFIPSVFAHIDESAVFGKNTPFHKDGPYNPFKE